MRNNQRIEELGDMELEAIKKIHPKHILKDLNAKIAKEGRDYVLAYAPYRIDENPSLNYFLNSKSHWLWKDMVDGKAGSHIDLYIQTKNMTYIDAVRYLREKRKEWELTQEKIQRRTKEIEQAKEVDRIEERYRRIKNISSRRR
ncbi:MAG: hypothetical protein QXV17_09960 [Candidatus Micrarchaeaceae archaeon]